MRPPIVFISSTYRDLKYERALVFHRLSKRGDLTLVRMEEHLHKEFLWERWSTNRAMQCDIFLRLYDQRIGSRERLFVSQNNQTFVQLEFERAQPWAMRCISYQLNRPFPDRDLMWIDDEVEYEASLKLQDSSERVSAEARWMDESWVELNQGIPIGSIAQLELRLQEDLHIGSWELARHRIRNWARCYRDNTSAAWRNAFEDESHKVSTSRLGLRWRLRKPLGLFLLMYAVLLATTFSAKGALLMSTGLVLAVAIAALAYAPTFVWIGTKTLIARGMFSLRTIQCPRDAPYRLIRRWRLLERWSGLGAVTVVFPDGRRVFVPLVNSPEKLNVSSARTHRVSSATEPEQSRGRSG